MKRDFDLIRKLLIFFEEKETSEQVQVPPIDDYDETAIRYHLVLLYEAGFLRCEPATSETSDRVIYVLPFNLTWDGHEFLAKIKSDGTWSRIRNTIESKGGALAFSVINSLATTLAQQVVDA